VALAVSHRHVQSFVAQQERTFSRRGPKVNPAVLKFPGSVVPEGCQWSIVIGRDQQAGLEEGLKTIADSKDQLVGIAKTAQVVSQKMRQLLGENLASGNFVTVSEVFGDHKDLKAV